MEEHRVRVAPDATVAASALRYDAECNREVAASMRAQSRRVRERAASIRDDNAAVRAQSNLALARARRLARPPV